MFEFFLKKLYYFLPKSLFLKKWIDTFTINTNIYIDI